jgi:uncharacterized HAD superfamily protein
MIIGMDIDDVLADSMPPLLRWYNREHGTNYTKDQVHHFQLEKTWGGTHKAAKNLIRNVYFHSPEFDEILPREDALENVKILSKIHKLIAITGRTQDIDNKTRSWLDRYFPKLFPILYSNDEWVNHGPFGPKLNICKSNDVDLLIEDSIETARKCATEGVKVLLFDQPWNQLDQPLPENIIRVKNWDEIAEKIESMN